MTSFPSPDPILPDKIQLLMEEASCDRAEAELAMSLVGFDLEKAIRTIGTLLRHIVVVKGKFVETDQNLHGLLLLIADTRRNQFIRARAVVSYNPALYETSLSQHWYDFERCIYAARLGEGALQQVSQDLERSFIDQLEAGRDAVISALKSPDQKDLPSLLNDGLAPSFPRGVQSVFVPELIDWNQFRRFPIRGEDRAPSPRPLVKTGAAAAGEPDGPAPAHETGEDARPHGPGETLRIQMELVPDEQGQPVGEVRVGDRLFVCLTDGRDIAHYVAKLFGAMNENGPHPFEAPVETIQKEGGRTRLFVRLSAGILGWADAPDAFRARVLPREPDRWWRRVWGRGPG